MKSWITGIYAIACEVNGMVYVGQSIRCIANRWKQHLYMLEDGDHFIKELQYDWNDYGEEAFSFNILEEIDFDTMRHNYFYKRENHWIRQFGSRGLAYNDTYRVPKYKDPCTISFTIERDLRTCLDAWAADLSISRNDLCADILTRALAWRILT